MANSTPSLSKKPRASTKVSLCLPSSLLSETNVKSLEQATHVANQIARSALTYNISEIVILSVPTKKEMLEDDERQAGKKVTTEGNAGNKKIKFVADIDETSLDLSLDQGQSRSPSEQALLLATLLQYFVTPDYLVRAVFKSNSLRSKLRYAQKLPKVSTLPFMQSQESKNYKEGFTIAKRTPKIQKSGKKTKPSKKLQLTKYVNIGKAAPLELSGTEIPVNVRVTVDVKNKQVVSPEKAYGVEGCKSAFGYHVRLASRIVQVFTELGFPEGYTESLFVNAGDYVTAQPKIALPELTTLTSERPLIFIANIKDLDRMLARDPIDGLDNITDLFDGRMEVPAGVRVEDATLISCAKVLHS